MLLRYDQVSRIRQKHPHQRIVLGSGVFDLFHVAHLSYIRRLQRHGEIVVIMVNSDERVRSMKGDFRPIIPDAERVRIIEAIKGVDYAFIVPNKVVVQAAGDPTVKELFALIRPDVFVTSNPVWSGRPYFDHTELVLLPRHKGGKFKSTTHIIRRLTHQGSQRS